jgi:hypothetical protein
MVVYRLFVIWYYVNTLCDVLNDDGSRSGYGDLAVGEPEGSKQSRIAIVKQTCSSRL